MCDNKITSPGWEVENFLFLKTKRATFPRLSMEEVKIRTSLLQVSQRRTLSLTLAGMVLRPDEENQHQGNDEINGLVHENPAEFHFFLGRDPRNRRSDTTASVFRSNNARRWPLMQCRGKKSEIRLHGWPNEGNSRKRDQTTSNTVTTALASRGPAV